MIFVTLGSLGGAERWLMYRRRQATGARLGALGPLRARLDPAACAALPMATATPVSACERGAGGDGVLHLSEVAPVQGLHEEQAV